MKKNFVKKLALKKQTIAHLDKKSMSYLLGGNDAADSSGPLTCSCPTLETCNNSCTPTLCYVKVTKTGCPPTE